MSCDRYLMIGAVVVVLVVGTIIYSEAQGAEASFYVATTGNDAWSGTLPAPNAAKTDGPFATLGRACGQQCPTTCGETHQENGALQIWETGRQHHQSAPGPGCLS